MPLTPDTKQELERELKVLRQNRKRIDSAIEAIESVLRFDRVNPRAFALMKSSAPGGARRSRPPLWHTVFAVIRETPGLTPAEVARRLKDKGVSVGGKTSLRLRVQKELTRMAKRRSVRRNPGGGYVLATDEPKADPSESPHAG